MCDPKRSKNATGATVRREEPNGDLFPKSHCVAASRGANLDCTPFLFTGTAFLADRYC